MKLNQNTQNRSTALNLIALVIVQVQHPCLNVTRPKPVPPTPTTTTITTPTTTTTTTTTITSALVSGYGNRNRNFFKNNCLVFANLWSKSDKLVFDWERFIKLINVSFAFTSHITMMTLMTISIMTMMTLMTPMTMMTLMT